MTEPRPLVVTITPEAAPSALEILAHAASLAALLLFAFACGAYFGLVISQG